MTTKLDWRGARVREQVVAAIAAGLTEFGLRHETAAKSDLRPRRGVITGTLRRSVHAAPPSYAYAGDHVRPASTSPERGGSAGSLGERNGRIEVVVGSGMRYAKKVHDRYRYITAAHERLVSLLPGILQKHAAAQGLTR